MFVSEREGRRRREGGREGSVLSVADSVTHACPRHAGGTVCALETSRCFSQLLTFERLVFPSTSPEGRGRRAR